MPQQAPLTRNDDPIEISDDEMKMDKAKPLLKRKNSLEHFQTVRNVKSSPLFVRRVDKMQSHASVTPYSYTLPYRGV